MNAQCTTAMLRETSFWGHKVKSIYKTAADVMTMMEKIVVQEEADRLQAKDGTTMTREMKKKTVRKPKRCLINMLWRNWYWTWHGKRLTKKLAEIIRYMMNMSLAVRETRERPSIIFVFY
jgi:hypothetical protein